MNEADGDCYQVAGDFIAHTHRSIPDVVLVHGIVTGQGKIAGKRHGHAWIEIADMVIDGSNAKQLAMRIEDYYTLGEIVNPSKYTWDEAIKLMFETEHYGPWDNLPTDQREEGSNNANFIPT